MYWGIVVTSPALKKSWKNRKSTARKPTISPRSSARLTPAILASPLSRFARKGFLEGRTSRLTAQASVSMLAWASVLQ